MAIASRIFTDSPIRNGLAAAHTGGTVQLYDGDRTQHIPSGDALLFFANLDGRYRNKPGPNGSGNWEL